MTDRWYVDGVESGTVPPDDRGLAYGDGLFETIAVRRGAARFMDYHVRRLQEGALRLDIPVDTGTLTGHLEHMAAGLANGTIRLTVTRGSGPRGYAPPAHPHPRWIAAVSHIASGAPPSRAAWPIEVVTCRTVAARSPATAGLKTLAAVERVLASREVRDAGAGEGLMFDPDGLVVGGTRTNVFLVRPTGVVTPDLRESGVRGVMRGIVMETARDLGLAVTEAPCTRGMLDEAVEVFLTNALMGLRPVRRIDGRTLDAGPVTMRIALGLRARGVTECPA